MARIHRVPEGQSSSSQGPSRIRRLDAIISKAERLITSAEKQKDPKTANSLRKKAKATARLASRLIGVMVIEFNQDVSNQIEKTRMVFVRDQEAQNRLNPNGAKT